MASDACEIKECTQAAYMTYKGRGVCQKHWDKHCDGGKVLLKNKENFKNVRR